MVFLGLDKKGCETPCLKDPFCDSAVVDVAILTQNVQQIVQNDFDIIELDIMDITCDLFKCIFYSKDGENFCLSSHPSITTYDPIAGPNSCYPDRGHNDSQACHLNWYVSFSSCWRRIGDCTDKRANPPNFNLTEGLLSVWERSTVPRDCWDPCVRLEIESELDRLCSMCDLDNCSPVCSRTWTDVLTSILGQSKNKKCGTNDTNGFLYEIEHDCECRVFFYDHCCCKWQEYAINSYINPDDCPVHCGCVGTCGECENVPLYNQPQWDFYHSVVNELINVEGGGSIENPICITRCFKNCGPGNVCAVNSCGDQLPENCVYSFYAKCYRKRCTNEQQGLNATCLSCDNIKCMVEQYTLCCENPCECVDASGDSATIGGACCSKGLLGGCNQAGNCQPISCDSAACSAELCATGCGSSNKYVVRATRLLCIDGPFKRVVLRIGTLFKNPNPSCQDVLIRMRYCVKIPQEEFLCICGYCPAGERTPINDQCKKRLNLTACELANIKNCDRNGCVESFVNARGCDLDADNTILNEILSGL